MKLSDDGFILIEVLKTDIDENGNFVVPESVTEIGKRAFSSCRNLTSIIIREGVTKIGAYAFCGAYYLTSITIPEGVTKIEHHAFMDCQLTSVTLPTGFIEIGSAAFARCNNLTSITIPEGVTEIGTVAFLNCRKLTSVTLPKSLITIPNFAFSECESLTSITIAEGIQEIGFGAFKECTKLREITINTTNPIIFEHIKKLLLNVLPEGGSSTSIIYPMHAKLLQEKLVQDFINSCPLEALYGHETLPTDVLGVISEYSEPYRAVKNLQKAFADALIPTSEVEFPEYESTLVSILGNHIASYERHAELNGVQGYLDLVKIQISSKPNFFSENKKQSKKTVLVRMEAISKIIETYSKEAKLPELSQEEILVIVSTEILMSKMPKNLSTELLKLHNDGPSPMSM